jgi:hypothetical protein
MIPWREEFFCSKPDEKWLIEKQNTITPLRKHFQTKC